MSRTPASSSVSKFLSAVVAAVKSIRILSIRCFWHAFTAANRRAMSRTPALSSASEDSTRRIGCCKKHWNLQIRCFRHVFTAANKRGNSRVPVSKDPPLDPRAHPSLAGPSPGPIAIITSKGNYTFFLAANFLEFSESGRVDPRVG